MSMASGLRKAIIVCWCVLIELVGQTSSTKEQLELKSMMVFTESWEKR